MPDEMTDGVYRSASRGWRPGRVGGRRADDEPTILVAVPPTGPADDPVRLATVLADSLRGRVLLATVASLPSITPYAAANSLHGARSERLRRLRERWEDSRPMGHVVVVAHSVTFGLLQLARQRDVAMIVLGLPGTQGGSRPWTGGDSSLTQLVTGAPCPVCLLERLPDHFPELLLLAVRSDGDGHLAWLVAEALFRCAPRESGRLRSSGRGGGADPAGAWSPSTRRTLRAVRTSRFTLERIVVADPASSGGHSHAHGADVLVAPAVEEHGIWPFRRPRVRTEVAEAFPGPVALIHGTLGCPTSKE